MSKRARRLLQTISFRLSDADYLKLEQQVKGTTLTVHDWCRDATLERLHRELGLSRSQRILFNQMVRTQYLIGLGLQLLADNKLTSEEWKKIRNYARKNLESLVSKSMDDLSSETDSASRRLPFAAVAQEEKNEY
jgi:hypothetical protein